MGIMTFSEKREDWGASDDRWYSPMFPPSVTGIEVTSEGALKNTAFWNGVNIICGMLSTFPLKPYRDLADGGKEVAREHPVWRVLARKAAPWLTPAQFKSMMQLHVLIHGNALARKVYSNGGDLLYLVPMLPTKVKLRVGFDGSITYIRMSEGGRPEESYDMEQIVHIRGLSNDGLLGYNPVLTCQEAIGLSLASEEYAARYFGQGTRPIGTLNSPNQMDRPAKENIAKSWIDAYTGKENWHKVAILDEGLEFKPIGMSPQEAQMLETRRFNVNEVARILNLPPHMVKDLSGTATGYNSILQQFIEFGVVTMTPLTVSWQEELNIKLFTEVEQQTMYTKFSMEGMMRGDPEQRAAFYTSLMGLAALTPNEILMMEDKNPIGPEGDRRFISVQYLDYEQQKQAPAPGVQRALPEGEERSVAKRRNLARSWERRFRQDADKFITRQVEGVRRLRDKHIRSDKDAEERTEAGFIEAVRAFFADHKEDIRRTMLPGFVAYATLVHEEAAREVKQDPDMDDAMLRKVDEYVDAMADRQSESSLRQVEKIVATVPPEQIGVELDRQLDTWQNDYPEDIADRESVKLGAFMALATWATYKNVRKKINVGADACPYCRRIAAQMGTIDIESPFVVEGQEVDPEVEGLAPMAVKRTMSHPPFHSKCHCYMSAEVVK